MDSTTARAFRRFIKNTLAEARRAEFCGQRKYAATLRQGVGEAIIEHRAIMPPPVDPETRKRREKARAWAAVALNTPGVPRSH